jgi:hypothetical protein
MLKRLAFLMIATSCLLTVRADTITQINSSASETKNNSGSPTQNLLDMPNGVWAPAFDGSNWVSFAQTGNVSEPGYLEVPNGTAVTFSDTFNLAGTVTAATLMVLADDTSSVVLNGTTIFAANPFGPNSICSSVPIGCLTSTEGVFTLAQLGPYLDLGSNTISFTAYQTAGLYYGLDYSGSFTTTPEPGTLVLLATGVVGLAFVGWRRVLG